jgi:hypothetical protein
MLTQRLTQLWKGTPYQDALKKIPPCCYFLINLFLKKLCQTMNYLPEIKPISV